MADREIRFDDGAAYENFMGVWSRSTGETFLDWLKPEKGCSWLDVGCGNGAFTELLVERVAPRRILGVDPSEAQLEYARNRHKAGIAEFVKGDAMALPVTDRSFDAAVMALVIFFIPDPVKGVAEMVRAVRPGGSISTYAWDMMGGGFPLHATVEELEAMNIPSLMPPSIEASRTEALQKLWSEAGLVEIEARVIPVQRSFADFGELWATNLQSPRLSVQLAEMPPDTRGELKERVRSRLVPGVDGPIICTARANAVKGRVPS